MYYEHHQYISATCCTYNCCCRAQKSWKLDFLLQCMAAINCIAMNTAINYMLVILLKNKHISSYNICVCVRRRARVCVCMCVYYNSEIKEGGKD